jgi:hypothetical protein
LAGQAKRAANCDFEAESGLVVFVVGKFTRNVRYYMEADEGTQLDVLFDISSLVSFKDTSAKLDKGKAVLIQARLTLSN